MEHYNHYEPPVGGRINSPKFRGAESFIKDFPGLPAGVTRFDLLKLVKQAGPSAGFTPKMIQLLEYYLLFTQECDWKAGNQPIVYQALTKTALQLDISERQVQRLEKDLFTAGALTWQDSGNHRRYGVRSDDGEIMYAFGVDLTPLAALRETLQAKLAEKRRRDEEWMEIKRQISWYRAQIRSLINEATDYPALDKLRFETEQNYEGIAVSIRTYMTIADLQTMLQAHKDLREAIFKAVQTEENRFRDAEIYADQLREMERFNSSGIKERSSMDDSPDVHIYSTNQNQFNKLKLSSPEDKAASGGSVVQSPGDITAHPVAEGVGNGKGESEIADEIGKISLKQVVYASSDRFQARLPRGGKACDFTEIADAAHSLLPELGIHKSAWGEACRVLGRSGAAICVMIIDQKSQDPATRVRNPGGYLREMTARAEKGQLNLMGSVFGLLKRGEEKHDA